MNNDDDNDVVTKKDIRLLEQRINDSFDRNFDEKFDQKFKESFDRSFDERFYPAFHKSFDEGFARGFGIIKEHFDGVFKMTREHISDVPERTTILETKFEENNEEHSDFRMRIGVLERAVK